MRQHKAFGFWVALLAATGVYGQPQAPVTIVVRVPGTSNPYLAGMPDGTTARVGDKAPEQSPVLVELPIAGAVSVSFWVASGVVDHIPDCQPRCSGPTGRDGRRHMDGAEHGIADIGAPINSLVGLFLDDQRPDRSRPPRALRFEENRRPGLDFRTLAPELKQIFYIGSGTTSAGAVRTFTVPKKATRLFLGVMDGYEWNNNTGYFSVRVNVERTDVSSDLFQVDSEISYAKWICAPDRERCTPERVIVETRGTGRYHVVLPPGGEASIPIPSGTRATVERAAGNVCPQGRSDSCAGPEEALVSKTGGGHAVFSVKQRSGAELDGYFEFDVAVGK